MPRDTACRPIRTALFQDPCSHSVFLVLALADPQQAQGMRQRSLNAVCWSSSADRTTWVSFLDFLVTVSHREVALMLPCARRDQRVCNSVHSGNVEQIVEILVRRPGQAGTRNPWRTEEPFSDLPPGGGQIHAASRCRIRLLFINALTTTWTGLLEIDDRAVAYPCRERVNASSAAHAVHVGSFVVSQRKVGVLVLRRGHVSTRPIVFVLMTSFQRDRCNSFPASRSASWLRPLPAGATSVWRNAVGSVSLRRRSMIT